VAGKVPPFNCINLQLTADDLDRLETAIRDRTLPRTEGFLFGVSDGSEVDDDLAFVSEARDALAAGLAVFYVQRQYLNYSNISLPLASKEFELLHNGEEIMHALHSEMRHSNLLCLMYASYSCSGSGTGQLR
jgi:hypothetical protein